MVSGSRKAGNSCSIAVHFLTRSVIPATAPFLSGMIHTAGKLLRESNISPMAGMNDSYVEPHLAGLNREALPHLERSKLRLVLEQVRSAFNAGALFRTADAAAVEKVYLVGLTPHPPQAQLEKTALGATRYVPWLHREKSSEVIEELRSDGYSLVALDNGPGAVDFWDFCWPKRTALVAGSEVDGVSDEMLKACSGRVNIPMYGYKRSLNVTTALGIAIYEYLRTFHCGQGLTPTESEQAPMRGDCR